MVSVNVSAFVSPPLPTPSRLYPLLPLSAFFLKWAACCTLYTHHTSHFAYYYNNIKLMIAAAFGTNLPGESLPGKLMKMVMKKEGLMGLAGNVGICVCWLNHPNDRHFSLSPTCRECQPNTLATFCYVSHFFGCRCRVGESYPRHISLHVGRNWY